jgi:hypothetical protein
MSPWRNWIARWPPKPKVMRSNRIGDSYKRNLLAISHLGIKIFCDTAKLQPSKTTEVFEFQKTLQL